MPTCFNGEKELPRITQRIIAKKAGVSVNTVSRALNDKPDINPMTKKKIIEIAKESGYVPNLLAKSLKLGESKTIGVIVSNLFNPFFSSVTYGIDEKVRKKGYSIIICNSDSNYQREEEAIATLIKKRVDGILITPIRKSSLDASFLQKAKIPCVLMMSHFKVEGFDYVGFDDKMGAFLATEHLINKGHRRILYLGGPPHFSLAQDRLFGYEKALTTYGIKTDQSLIKAVTPKLEEGYRAVKEILSTRFNFTAIFAFNDYLALGAMKAIFERGLKIPDDIALVGYDDIEFASLSIVPLTTIRLPKYMLGNKSAEILLAKIKKQQSKTQSLLLKPELIVRDST